MILSRTALYRLVTREAAGNTLKAYHIVRTASIAETLKAAPEVKGEVGNIVEVSPEPEQLNEIV